MFQRPRWLGRPEYNAALLVGIRLAEFSVVALVALVVALVW